MRAIEEAFFVHRARSGLFSEYEPGSVPYIGNSLGDNAVVGLVTPLPKDTVFSHPAIAVSAFCEATVQLPPFVACGRSGNGLVVLEPRLPMGSAELAYFAAYINQALRWRFNWYRQITADRLRWLPIPDSAPPGLTFPVKTYLPPVVNHTKRPHLTAHLRGFALGAIFDLRPGDYHALSGLQSGTIPVVSCGDENNGIAGYFEVEHTYRDRLTIALNGSTLSTKYHPYVFGAKDDVAVCIPRQPLRLTTLLFVQVMLNRERWRYSYYRKCYLNKLPRFEVMLPAVSDSLDENTMERMVEITPYWGYLSQRLEAPPAS